MTTLIASQQSLLAALLALGVCLFWNGIVSVFVALATAGTIRALGYDVPEWFPAPDSESDGLADSMGGVLFLWLFLTPFITIGLGLIGGVLFAIYGSVRVSISQDDATVGTGAGPFRWRKKFEPADIAAVRLSMKKRLLRQENRDEFTPAIELRRDQKDPIFFGTGLTKIRRQWLILALRDELGR